MMPLLGILAIGLTAAVPVAVARDKIVILVIGKPGSGKTTQAKNISRRYKVPAWSMSDLLEKEAGWVGSSLKKGMKAGRASGDLVDDLTANRLVTKYITTKKARNGFLLDGYPGNAQQSAYLSEQLLDLGLPRPIVIHIDVPTQVAIQRMIKRKRIDDTPETIERRMNDYLPEEQRMLKLFPPEQIISIDGTGAQGQAWKAIQLALKEAGH